MHDFGADEMMNLCYPNRRKQSFGEKTTTRGGCDLDDGDGNRDGATGNG